MSLEFCPECHSLSFSWDARAKSFLCLNHGCRASSGGEIRPMNLPGPSEHESRLRAMLPLDQQTWDVSARDVAAIRWALDENERLRASCVRAGEAIRALQNALMRWDDNGLQIAEAQKLAHKVSHEILHVIAGRANHGREDGTGPARPPIPGDTGGGEDVAGGDETT